MSFAREVPFLFIEGFPVGTLFYAPRDRGSHERDLLHAIEALGPRSTRIVT